MSIRSIGISLLGLVKMQSGGSGINKINDMKRIYKYPVPIDDTFDLELPLGSEILTVQMQKEIPQMWVVCNPGALKAVRHFYIYGTGMQVQDNLIYIGSFQMLEGNLIWHLFEGIK